MNLKVENGKVPLHDFHKSSLSEYAGTGNLKVETTDIYSFENADAIKTEGKIILCEKHTEDTVGGVTVAFDKDGKDMHPGLIKILECSDLSFSVNDIMKETVKLFVYVEDIDKIMCDHDNVHEIPQKGHATFWIQFANDESFRNCYNLQHTFEKSGWHMLEIAFNTDNQVLPSRLSRDLSDVRFMRICGFTFSGLKIKFAGLQKCTYSNDGYEKPVCPKNGRWLSTFDFDALDGAIVTEWYASSFDTENKTTGHSSLSITGHKLHEDFRVVCGGMKEVIRDEDTLHFDMYISDINRLNFASSVMRLGHQEGNTGGATYFFRYSDLENISLQKKPLHNGWNEIDVPIKNMHFDYDKKYYPARPRVVAEHFCSFIDGAGEREYTLKYDNMYLY